MNEQPHPKLDELIGRLPRAIAPARDLWPEVGARIALLRPRLRGWEFAVAAALAAVTVSAMFIGFSHDSQPRVAAPQWAYEQLDATYRPLRLASLERYRLSAAGLDPELRKTVEANLSIIDGALSEIRLALASRPSDAALGQMLQRTYEQELAIIEAVAPQTVAQDPTRYRGEL